MSTDLMTRCATCREVVVISSLAAQMARPIECPHCKTASYLWRFVGQANRQTPPELAGTWEGAR